MLSPKQQIVLDALLAGEMGREAARRADIAPQQVSRWKKLPEFQKALEKAQHGIISGIVGKLTELVPASMQALKACLKTGNATVKVRAAGMVLDTIFRGVEANMQLEKLEELEATIHALTEGQAGQVDGPGAQPPGESLLIGGRPLARPGEPAPDGGDGAVPLAG